MPRHFGWESFGFGFGPRGFFWAGPRRRRRQWFESGDMKYVILKVLKDKPRHGYEVMKELEDQLRGCYSPSAGTVYPTLQLQRRVHGPGRGRIAAAQLVFQLLHHLVAVAGLVLEHLEDDVLHVAGLEPLAAAAPRPGPKRAAGPEPEGERFPAEMTRHDFP